MRFRDRVDAGRHLAEVARTSDFGGLPLAVLGLPRGGVPVAFEVARALDAPLDVLVVRKLGVPFQPELAMGAIGEGGVRVENDDVLRPAGLGAADVDAAERRERPELDRRATIGTGAGGGGSTSGAAASSWWTTVWPPARRPVPPAR